MFSWCFHINCTLLTHFRLTADIAKHIRDTRTWTLTHTLALHKSADFKETHSIFSPNSCCTGVPGSFCLKVTSSELYASFFAFRWRWTMACRCSRTLLACSTPHRKQCKTWRRFLLVNVSTGVYYCHPVGACRGSGELVFYTEPANKDI